jgi:hypothetical protein
MVANTIGHSFDRAVGVSSRERGAGLVRLRTVRLDADSVGIAFRREQGIVVAHAMGHSFDRADGVSGPGRGAGPSYSRPMPRRPRTDGGDDPQARSIPSECGGPPVARVANARGRPPPSESQIGHSPIPTRRCPQIHRDRPVATCESGKRVLT